MNRPVVGITLGDINGVGSEILLKALENKSIYDDVKPVIIGSNDVIKENLKMLNSSIQINTIDSPEDGNYIYGKLDLIDLDNINKDDIRWGQIDEKSGRASFEYIKYAIELALEGKIDAIVTGPIHKEAINKAGYKYAGHTEILADLTKTDKVSMMLTDKNMRVTHVTTHIPMKDVSEHLTKDRIKDVIKLTKDALIQMGIKDPRIAVAGYNPHSGENGLFAMEEIEKIKPAVYDMKEKGINVEGPISPDTVFVSMMGGQYDSVVAMYHDQGHIPMKVMGFKQNEEGKMLSMSGVNVTLGLPIIRTSVDHGTAFDKAGKGLANPESMIDAIELAGLMARNK